MQAPHGLLIILHLLIVIDGLLIIIIVIIGSSSGTNAKTNQISRSQRGIGVGDGWEDGHVRELKKRLILLTVDNLLDVSNYLKALIHHIHVLIRATTHGKDTPEHLQETRAGASGGGGATIVGRVRRSHSWKRRSSAVSPQILGHCGAKWFMCVILIELLICHNLNHALNIM
jgi:hypothetical protein